MSSANSRIVHRAGRILSDGNASDPMQHPFPGIDEQEADDWFRKANGATVTARRFAAGVENHTVSVAGQMHGTMLSKLQS